MACLLQGARQRLTCLGVLPSRLRGWNLCAHTAHEGWAHPGPLPGATARPAAEWQDRHFNTARGASAKRAKVGQPWLLGRRLPAWGGDNSQESCPLQNVLTKAHAGVVVCAGDARPGRQEVFAMNSRSSLSSCCLSSHESQADLCVPVPRQGAHTSHRVEGVPHSVRSQDNSCSRSGHTHLHASHA